MDNDSSPDPPRASGLLKIWQEMKRRKVMRVAITYAVVAWLIIQVAETTFEGFGIPIWAFRFVMLMVILGFPLAIILAWAFELTPDGLKTTKAAQCRRAVGQVLQDTLGDAHIWNGIERQGIALGSTTTGKRDIIGACGRQWWIDLGRCREFGHATAPGAAGMRLA